MFFHLVTCFWSFILDLAAICRLAESDKDLEILLLRQQLRLVERKQRRAPAIPRWQKVVLAVLAFRLKQQATDARTRLEASLRLFKPETVLGWHRALVRRKWTYAQGRKPGRPPIAPELEGWIIQVAKENPGLGFDKLEGELRKLGFDVSATTVRTVLLRHGIPPAPERARHFLAHLSEPLQGAVPRLRFLHD